MRTVELSYNVLRRGAYFGKLQASEDGGATIRGDSSAEIKTALSGSFVPLVLDADGREVEADWLSDEIQPVLTIDGEDYPLGVFAASSLPLSEEAGVESMRLETMDRCWRVRETRAEACLYFAAGTNYVAAIKQLLVAAGISVVLATPTDRTLAEDREWDVGASHLTVANQLLGEINYNPLYFTKDGYAVIEPASVPTAEKIRHRISTSPDEIRAGADPLDPIMPAVTRDMDIYNAPNVFICTCANPDKSDNMTASAMNTNPQSPLSISRRGRRIVEVEQLDNIASQQELQTYAERKRNLSMIRAERITVHTALLPNYSLGDVVGLHLKYEIDDGQHTREEELDALCVLRAYTMELRVGGTMTIELERVVLNLD